MADRRIVYVVDDDFAVGDAVGFFLTTLGFETRKFLDGRTFITAAPGLRSGCVLLDVRMPEFDGFDVLGALGDRIAALPVIVMTGHGDVATAVRAMKLGASDFLEKPCEEEAMLGTLSRVFGSLESESQNGAQRNEARTLISRLTRREREILHGLMAGLSNKILAFDLGLSVRTVEMHRSHMMERLHVRTLSDALRIAFQAGVSSEGPSSGADDCRDDRRELRESVT